MSIDPTQFNSENQPDTPTYVPPAYPDPASPNPTNTSAPVSGAYGYAPPTPPMYAHPAQPQQPYAPQPEMSATPLTGGYGQFGVASAGAQSFQGGYGTVIPLRPMGIGDTLDAAFRLLKFNPVAYFVFPLIMGLIAGVLSAVFELLSGETSVMTTIGSALDAAASVAGVGTIFSTILMLVVQIFVTIVGTRVTISSVRGRKVGLKESFSYMRQQAGRLFARVLGFEAIVGAVFGLVAVIFFALAIAVAGPALLLIADQSAVSPDSFPTQAFGILLLLLFMFALLWLALWVFYLRFALAPSAIVAEGIGPIQAIRRSWNLTKGSFGYLLGTVLVVSLIVSVVSGMVIGVFSLVAALVAMSASASATPIVTFISSVGFPTALAIAFAPVQCVLMNLIYVNMRFRRENFHLNLIQEANASYAQA
ncbi:MAG: hypothetical protein MR006_02130 [Arcanobacterium sp.]|nr:hypothetical protein [Arcanobacterium sp.]MDY5589309.1 hypothetical protein [Arcanobacterium sp.]